IRRLLRLRRRHAGLWTQGSWEPVEVVGARSGNVLAFERRRGDSTMVGAALLRCADGLVDQRQWVPPRRWWGDTRLGTNGDPLVADLFGPLPVYLSLSHGMERAKGIEPSS
ncbi:MAG TPA: hypothetical protein VN231_12370, partial [Allosphingosinicella sp.]|nr:hypothetical protein [Allosphingosinicella sp.]